MHIADLVFLGPGCDEPIADAVCWGGDCCDRGRTDLDYALNQCKAVASSVSQCSYL